MERVELRSGAPADLPFPSDLPFPDLPMDHPHRDLPKPEPLRGYVSSIFPHLPHPVPMPSAAVMPPGFFSLPTTSMPSTSAELVPDYGQLLQQLHMWQVMNQLLATHVSDQQQQQLQQPAPSEPSKEPTVTRRRRDSERTSICEEEMIVPSHDKEGWCRNKKYIEKTGKGYMCTVCKKVYGRYNSVSYHVTIYHRNPPIKCDMAGCQFTTREARYIHFHKFYRHGVPLPQTIDQGSRRCPHCRHVSKSPAMLEKHIKRHVINGDDKADSGVMLMNTAVADLIDESRARSFSQCEPVKEEQPEQLLTVDELKQVKQEEEERKPRSFTL